MPRVDRFNELPSKLTIHVYADHLPLHFHVRSPSANVKIDIQTLQIIRGRIEPGDFAHIVAWATKAENRTRLRAAWKQINERD